MNTPTSPKVTAGGITGAAALVITWGAGQAGLEIPAEVAIAIVTVAIFIAGYFTPDPLRQDVGIVELDPEAFDEDAHFND